MILTDGATFTMALIKRAKNRVNKNQDIALDTKRRIREIAIKNGWKTQLVHIFHEICDGKFIFEVKISRKLPKHVKI